MSNKYMDKEIAKKKINKYIYDKVKYPLFSATSSGLHSLAEKSMPLEP